MINVVQFLVFTRKIKCFIGCFFDYLFCKYQAVFFQCDQRVVYLIYQRTQLNDFYFGSDYGILTGCFHDLVELDFSFIK